MGDRRRCSVASTADRFLAATRTPFSRAGDHPGVVEHQHVAGPQQGRQVAHLPVGKRRRPAPPPAAARSRAGSPAAARCGPRADRSRSRRAAWRRVKPMRGRAAVKRGGGPARQRTMPLRDSCSPAIPAGGSPCSSRLACARRLPCCRWAGRSATGWDLFTHFVPIYLAGGGCALVLRLVAGSDGGRTLSSRGSGDRDLRRSDGPRSPGAAARRPAASGGNSLKLIQFNLWEHKRGPASTAAGSKVRMPTSWCWRRPPAPALRRGRPRRALSLSRHGRPTGRRLDRPGEGGVQRQRRVARPGPRTGR